MEWEDTVNEIVAAGQITPMPPPEQPGAETYAGRALGMAATTAWRDPEGPPAYPTTGANEAQTVYPTGGAISLGICSRNNHRFECKHELRCFCGQVERLPLDLAEGL